MDQWASMEQRSPQQDIRTLKCRGCHLSTSPARDLPAQRKRASGGRRRAHAWRPAAQSRLRPPPPSSGRSSSDSEISCWQRQISREVFAGPRAARRDRQGLRVQASEKK
ncbi:unnamed protein product [Prorocentrum cordatum]|uniref:Uncharacterized protein n=1 Tax=Prorocentrum cordatum TaxID=2364126 RepID=A0ABN9Y9R9_9DINO|nr:unnamed protein product [Polarella glacialis]